LTISSVSFAGWVPVGNTPADKIDSGNVNFETYLVGLSVDGVNGISSISDISVSKCTGPFVWNEAKKVYYVELDLSGQWIAPGYAWDSGGPLCDFSISSKGGSWNSVNDWSFADWDATYTNGSRKYAPNVPIYEGSTLLAGTEPANGPINTYKMGDVTHNGMVDIIDALMIAQYAAGIIPSVFYPENADVNADGKTNILDALFVARQAAGL
jgi:hypothetical protein